MSDCHSQSRMPVSFRGELSFQDASRLAGTNTFNLDRGWSDLEEGFAGVSENPLGQTHHSRPPIRYFGLTALELRIRRAVSNLEKAFFATAKQHAIQSFSTVGVIGTTAIG
jgi:hypothetical protein